jgi:cell division protein FtsL
MLAEAKSMNAQLSFVANRQFWAGVLATIVVGILIALGVPNLMRTRMALYNTDGGDHQTGTRLETAGKRAREQLTLVASLSGTEQERKVIRTASLDIVVKNPRQTSEKIRVLAEQAGGFLVSSETNGGENASSASLTIRIPVDKFEQVRAEISSLGLRVESEKLEAQDVTRQYVDLAARLRNLRAQESQYLGILKQARTVKDTVEVSDKLGEVRSEIEQQQAEFDALSKQVATVALTVSLRAEAEAQLFGLHWRPLYQLKLAVRDGIDGIGDYATAMASFVFYIPAILLWLATILIGAAVLWRALRWVVRTLFVPRVKGA